MTRVCIGKMMFHENTIDNEPYTAIIKVRKDDWNDIDEIRIQCPFCSEWNLHRKENDVWMCIYHCNHKIGFGYSDVEESPCYEKLVILAGEIK